MSRYPRPHAALTTTATRNTQQTKTTNQHVGAPKKNNNTTRRSKAKLQPTRNTQNTPHTRKYVMIGGGMIWRADRGDRGYMWTTSSQIITNEYHFNKTRSVKHVLIKPQPKL